MQQMGRKPTVPNWQAYQSAFDLIAWPSTTDPSETHLSCHALDLNKRWREIDIYFSLEKYNAGLQGTIDGTDDEWSVSITTNSSVFMQNILWILALPNTSPKLWTIQASPAPGYPYQVSDCIFAVTTKPQSGLVAAEVALPESTAEMPDDLRKAIERGRERQARLRVTPRA
jgi:hypothetical protein